MINAERVVAVVASESAPAKRLVQDARDSGRAIDCTCGKKNKSVIITDSDHVILSALSPETLAARLDGQTNGDSEDQAEVSV